MKTLLSIALLFFCSIAWSQNVGVNQPSPNYPLDVNGTTNIDGNLRINGVAGTSGQVLRTNAGGNTYWGEAPKFINERLFFANGSLTLPAGVTRVLIEMWGGGGGGAFGGGGGGGNYVRTLRDVTSGAVLTITVGDGGAGATSSTTNAFTGQTTNVSGAGASLIASGGRGASTTFPGVGVNYVGNEGLNIAITGGFGERNTISYEQRSSTQYVEVKTYGSGGGVWPDFNVKAQGVQTVYSSTGSFITRFRVPSQLYTKGLGGGGGDLNTSQDGGDGMVRISWE